MNGFAFYLIKSGIWLSGFTAVYFLFLRNERFFTAKRIFLITGIIASFAFPLFTFHYEVLASSPQQMPAPAFEGEIRPPVVFQESEPQSLFSYWYLLSAIYLSGILLLTGRMAYHMILIFRTINHYTSIVNEKAKIIRSAEYPSSFSFFNYVFINPSVEEADFRTILNHELVHIRQRHWFDLVLTETVRVLQWINPLAWIYSRFIRLNHEYLADETALKYVSDPSVYKIALLNQIFQAPAISLSNSFTYSLNENRFKMMKKIITSPYRKLKLLFILPVMAAIFYSFSEPVIIQPASEEVKSALLPLAIKDVKGVVLKNSGEPFPGVSIAVIGTTTRLTTDAQGKFTIPEIPENGYIMISSTGYLSQMLKPKSSDLITITLQKDPNYVGLRVSSALNNSLIVVDGVVVDKKMSELNPDELAKVTVLTEKERMEKYGEKGKAGVIEIITKENAEKFGIRVPVTRTKPEDYPTFQGQGYAKYAQWLATQVTYPSESAANRSEGRVTVNFTVQADGTIDPVSVISTPDKYLGDEVVRAIKAAPKWEPAVTSTARAPFTTGITLKFKLPNGITPDDTYVVVEQMPEYPGGSTALLEFIRNNTKYPAEALKKQIEGRVIVRFIVMADGKLEDPVILKGVDPLLDAEALRVVSKLTGWLPGAQGGKPVNVYYMVPVTFSLTDAKGFSSTLIPAPAPFPQPEQGPVFPGGQLEMLKAIAERMQYPAEAKTKRIQGRVVVKFTVAVDGKVTNPVIAESVDPLLDTEALRVVGSLPDFTPATLNGKPVEAPMAVPITFTLK